MTPRWDEPYGLVAAEALACSIGRVIGYERTAVCVVEPDAVMLSLVDTFDGEVETLVSHALDSEDSLVDWVTAVFDRDDWRCCCERSLSVLKV